MQIFHTLQICSPTVPLLGLGPRELFDQIRDAIYMRENHAEGLGRKSMLGESEFGLQGISVGD